MILVELAEMVVINRAGFDRGDEAYWGCMITLLRQESLRS
jgi:hypothetical protein